MPLSLLAMAKKKPRINESLRAYWEELRADKPYPRESEVDPEAIAKIWPSCFLVKIVEEEDSRYKYIYLGQDLIEAYGDDRANKEICEELVYPSNVALVHKFEDVEKSAAPVKDENHFVNPRGVEIKYRSVLLPLAREDGSVGYILGGMKWKAY